MVACRKNGFCAAHIQAACTTGFAGPGVGAQGFFQSEIYGLFEFTNPFPGCQGYALQFASLLRVSPEIAVAFLMTRKCRGTAPQVDKYIAFAAGGRLCLAITQFTPPGRVQGLQAGKLQFEIAKCAVGARQLTLCNIVSRGGQLNRTGIINNAGNSQLVLNQLGHSDGLLGGADNAADAVGLNGFRRCYGRRQLGSGNQSGLLGMLALWLCIGGAPAGSVPDINSMERRGVIMFGEQVFRQAFEQG